MEKPPWSLDPRSRHWAWDSEVTAPLRLQETHRKGATSWRSFPANGAQPESEPEATSNKATLKSILHENRPVLKNFNVLKVKKADGLFQVSVPDVREW